MAAVRRHRIRSSSRSRQPVVHPLDNQIRSKLIRKIDNGIRSLFFLSSTAYFELPNDKNAEIIREVFQSHNFYRACHGVPRLEFSERISRLAQAKAERGLDKLGITPNVEIFDGVMLGENRHLQKILMGPVMIDTKAAAKEAVKSWYSPISHYNFKKPTVHMETGSFTQVVWKDTRKIGIGAALSADKRIFCIVACYYPGALIFSSSSLEKNVFPRKV